MLHAIGWFVVAGTAVIVAAAVTAVWLFAADVAINLCLHAN